MIIKTMYFALENSDKSLKRYEADFGVDARNVDTDVDHQFITEAELIKLSNIENGANKYIHPTGVGYSHIPSGGLPGQVLKKGTGDNNYVWGDDEDTTYDKASILNDGLMTKEQVITLGNKANKSSSYEVVLTAINWTGDESPYSNKINITGVTMTNNIEILIDINTATKEQVETWSSAMIIGGTQTTGSVTLKAYGDKPEIDIPLIAIVRGDIE